MKMLNLEDIIKMSQTELFEKLKSVFDITQFYAFKDNKNKLFYAFKDKFIMIQGEAPIMLIAHLDTVHKEPVKTVCKSENGNIWMSPQGIGGDDRCGVYALLEVYRQCKIKPWLLFTCDEEIGGLGSEKFVQYFQKEVLPKSLEELKMLIEIDRKGQNDAVYYNCENNKFEKYITSKGFKAAYGSFSDISVIAPVLGVAAVNLSSGYYNAHTLHEYINISHLEKTIKRVTEIVDESISSEIPQYEYIDFYDDEWEGVNIEQMHNALLDYYNKQELEELIREYGER